MRASLRMKKSQVLKIGLVVDDTLDKPDGVQQYVLLVGAWLSAQGHEVHYLVGQSSRTDLPNVHSLAKNVPVTFNKNKLTVPLPANKRRIQQLLEQEKFDILHVQMPYSPLLAGRIVKLAPATTAIVGTFHILPFSRTEQIATRFLGTILRSSLRKFSEVIAVSEPARIFAKDAFAVNAQVLPNVVDLAWYKRRVPIQARPKSPVTIVFLGRLVERKGSLQLLRAVAALKLDTRQKLRVIIGGKGPLLPELTSFVSANNLADIVEFAGFVTEEDKPAFLHQAHIAAFPATGGESFGIVLLEAMAAGSGVVIGGNNPGYSSVLSEWPDVLIDPNDTAAFAQTLQGFIENEQSRQSVFASQQAAVDMYDVQVVGPQLVKLYQKSIAKPV